MKPLFVIIALVFTTTSFSQQFSSEPEQFIKDIKKYLGASNKQKTNEFIEVFEPNWLTNFSSEYQQRVVATSNKIFEKRRPPFPDLYGYLLSVHSFVETNQPKESFESWHTTIDQLLDSKKVSKFQTFIEVCAGFFTDGTIYYSTNHIWQVRGGKYTFEFDKNRPFIHFEDSDLCGYVVNRKAGKKDNPYFDSTIVRMTTGTYEPFAHKWTGRGGKVDWQKVGMDPASNYVEITDYTLSMKQTVIESDSATCYTDYYETPLLGSFQDRAKKINRDIDRVYPQFTSFSKRIEKKSILEDVDYFGGFSVKGADFNGVGFDKEPANLVFYKDDKPFVKTSALSYTINDKEVRASECRVVIYLSDEDTIYHPGLNVYYNLTSLEFSRDNEGLAQAPFKDSYHQLDMYVDKIVWTKGDDNLNLAWHFQSSQKIAKFESQNYFSQRVYNEIQGINKIHPLVALYQYSYKYDEQIFSIGKAASAMSLTTTQAIPILLGLANQGFLIYNKTAQTIELQPKTKKYIDARSGKSDYDNMVFTSNLNEIKKKPETKPDGSPDKKAIAYNVRADTLNARKSKVTSFGYLNLTSLDLALNEVDPIEISNAQKVVVFPDEGQVLIKKNRDFLFSGAIMAGKMEIYLSKGSFEYDNFRIELREVDAALLRVRPIFGGSNGLVPMYSHFKGINGYLEIDDPSNRSGKNDKDFEDYPILNSEEHSYVFYDHKSIYGGVYDSTDFYFKVDPFKFDSLDNFDEYSVAFDGELRSAGIFPKFRETIRIQDDYSFGFKTMAPEGGFDFYGENASFDNEIRLSNRGLSGAGQIDFITSTSISENFIFFPDSTMGSASYINKGQTKSEGISVPDVTGENIMVTYVPKEKILKARPVTSPLLFFEGEAVMKGITYLTPEGMTGRGLMYFGEAELGSRDFSYKRWVIDADTSDFNLEGVGENIEPEDENPLAFSTTNVNAHVDFESRKGEFKRNDGTSIVEFPKNQYICYMDMFTWFMDEDEMELSKEDISIDTDLDLKGSNFFSVHPEQDSLNFAAPKARFIMKKNIIECDKVEYIDVGDARIYPPGQQVVVRKKAKMDEFEDATIVANKITKFHEITGAHVSITARRAYTASGNYPYTDSKGEVQELFFANISLDTAYQTVATGEIPEDRNFHLSEKFDFYGTVELKAADHFLTFDGATRINHDCYQFARNWLKFRTDIDPLNIQIPVDEEMKDLEGNAIAVGMVKSFSDDPDSLGLYPAFLSSLIRPVDRVIFTSFGVLNFNEEAKEFRIASPEKLINRADTGNYISLHIESCSMEGDGAFDMAMDLPDVEFNPYGTFNYDAATKQTSLNVSGGLDFFYDKKAMEFMTNQIIATEGISGIDWERTTLSQALKEDFSETEAEELKSDYIIDGSVKKLPKEMSQVMYLTNLRLEWSTRPSGEGFVSKPISGIVSLYGNQIFKDFTVRLAINYARSGQRGTQLMIMVELPGGEKPGNYYFYRFERVKKKTELKIVTSDKELQDYLLLMKEDKMKEKDLSFEYRSNAQTYMEQFNAYWGE